MRSMTLICALAAGGCGYSLRAGVGPTLDTRGELGVLATIGGGYAIGVARHGAVLGGVEMPVSMTSAATRVGVRGVADYARRYEDATRTAWSVGLIGGGEWRTDGATPPDKWLFVFGTHAAILHEIAAEGFRTNHVLIGGEKGLELGFDHTRASAVGVDVEADMVFGSGAAWRDGRVAARLVIDLVQFADLGGP